MVFETQSRISFHDVDAAGNVTLIALIKYINDISWDNAKALGAGMEHTGQHGMVFVIQRFAMKILALPKLEDTITLKTWPGEITRSLFKRQGEIFNSAGEKILEWESAWVLIDINLRKIKRPTEFPLEYDLQGKCGVTVEADKIKIPEAAQTVASYIHHVRYSELDMLGHMNNSNYANLVANVLALSGKPGIKDVQKVQFNYVNEVREHDEIEVLAKTDGNRCFIVATGAEKVNFTAELTYKE